MSRRRNGIIGCGSVAQGAFTLRQVGDAHLHYFQRTRPPLKRWKISDKMMMRP